MPEWEEKECRVTLTIENRLELYVKEKKEERNEVLWYVWQQNKRWLSNILDWILTAFPNYSMHDKSHALSVLHNIEMLLGERQILKLSASDCFLILHVVFLHDIGMCITTSDRSKLMQNPKFTNFLKKTEETGNVQSRKYAETLLKYCSELGVEEKTEDVLRVKLDVYYAVIFLVAEYVRREHAENSQKMLEKWLSQSEKMGLGYGFSYSGIPRRLFYTVGACACVHNSSDFMDVMKLPKVDGGFANDYIHPRFAAVLLQLGDSLDLDNDRFHPLTKEVMGELPWESEVHYEKHNAIRRLRISPLKITVAADCSSPEALRLINRECNVIKNILQNAAYHWSAICPDDLDARLPNFEPVELRMNGQAISDRLINAEFKIQQSKAFNLLQGGNFYKDIKFVFLRELFQNAVDASKMQYWIDWTGSRWSNLDKEDTSAEEYSLWEMGKRLSPCTYPIEVELHLAKRKKESGKIISLDEKALVLAEKADKNTAEYGVLVNIIDYGIGISAEDIYAIADVGTSYEKNRKRREGMPSWLLPTAEFGIGLQSVFLIAESFAAYTHTRSGERYKIVFHATGEKGDGHIHVTPLKEEEMMRYGTKLEVFVPCTVKKKHQQELKTWCGKDPFEEDYADERPFRHARELAVQLAFFLDDLIGERIFPIELRLYDFEDEENSIYSQLLSGEIKKLNYSIVLNGKKSPSECCDGKHIEELSLEAKEEYIAWPFYEHSSNAKIIRGQLEKIEYMFDCEHMKLYIYDHGKYDVYARFGAERLLNMWTQARKCVQEEEENGTRIFYKGIYVESKEWKKDVNLLEYVDIKGKIERKYLRINRCEFTLEGQQYLEEQIYPHVLDIARRVLRHCKCSDVISKIEDTLEELKKEKKRNKIYNGILAAAGLNALAQIRNKDIWESEEEKGLAMKWNCLSTKALEVIKSGIDENKDWAESSMFHIGVYCLRRESGSLIYDQQQVSVVDIMNSNNKYAIMSARKSKGRPWKEFLIELDDRSTEPNNKLLPYICGDYIQLEQELMWQTRKEKLATIEKEGDDLLMVSDEIAKNDLTNSTKAEGKQYKILKWILHNIPSTEMFFSKNYDLRINVLGLEYSDSLYLNRYMRTAIWEK